VASTEKYQPRLTFPTIQENASALTVLPHWIEVCGRKIDNTAAVLDWAGVSSALCIFDITSMLFLPMYTQSVSLLGFP